MSRTAIPNEETVALARRPHIGTLSSSTLRHASDERLVSLTRGGSERAFAEIMRRYQRPLYVYCIQILGAARAEDAVQQAFLKAFVALRDGADREIALRPWLYRIARNCSIDLLRAHGSDDVELDPEYDGMPQPVAWAVIEQKEELAKLVAAIQGLPEGQRRAITLRELEGRSYGEISAELGHTHSGVRQLIFRARTTLRNLASVLLPVGSLRSRLLGQAAPVAPDPHHIAAAASLSPAGGGGAFETIGAILAATATLAAGGAATAPRHAHGDRPAQVQAFATPFTAAPAATGNALPAGRAHGSLSSRRSGGARAIAPGIPTPAPAPIVPAPIVSAPAPPPIAPAPLALSEAPPAAPAPAAGNGGGGAATTPQRVSVSGTPALAVASPPAGATGPSGSLPPVKGVAPARPVKPVPAKLPPAKPAVGGAGTQPGQLKPSSPKTPKPPKSPKLPAATKRPQPPPVR
jgi:RNA polymerase sigma-70 factor, ECF subfamily